MSFNKWCSKCRMLVVLSFGIAGLASAASAADEAREVLLRRISTLRGQIQSLDGQIEELQRKMPLLESGIEQLLDKLGSLKAPEPQEEQQEEPAARPRVEGFRPPLLRKVDKDTPIIIVCQNNRAAIVDLDEMNAAFKAIKNDSARLEAFIRANGGTLPAGDFDVRAGLIPISGGFALHYQVITPPKQPGESLQEALLPTSRLNRRLGGIEADKAVVQFFAFPDSFDVFRESRKMVWKGKLSVNWLPMSHGDPMYIGGGGPSAQ